MNTQVHPQALSQTQYQRYLDKEQAMQTRHRPLSFVEKQANHLEKNLFMKGKQQQAAAPPLGVQTVSTRPMLGNFRTASALDDLQHSGMDPLDRALL